jgi:ferrous iron transport protein A
MTMPLTMATPGEDVRLVNIRGGRKMKQRLADLGLNIGMTVRVVNGKHRGPLIVAVKDSRLAIGWGMAHRIIVQPAA